MSRSRPRDVGGEIIQLPFLLDVLVSHARTDPWDDNCCFAGRPSLKSEGIERLHDLVLLAVLDWKGAVAIRPRHNLHRDYRRSSFANAFR